MSPTKGRSPADETQANPATEQTCAHCGMKQEDWRSSKGYRKDGEVFCCEGCATGTGCTC